ncbi:MAG TPA: methylmalonyl Co-A mutase-associated GTPase MeaB [Dongiaceae bacterium]|nr:methylmalonyl Co-A mutase-associated GTPase MeaB [Dongiaceae bacterium]
MSALAALRTGGKAALAKALAEIESHSDRDETLALLDEAFAQPNAQVIGLTGPPGVGKSTLAGALINLYRAQGKTVGIIAVDPSSRLTGGALLGDRTRIRTDPDDAGIFIRSMAARDRLGGLADITYGAMVLMRALFDVVLVETVGVGQSETEISLCADTILFCVQPGSGDSLQYMKAGIAEIPDLVVVTKADLGQAASRAKADVKGALSLARSNATNWTPKVLMISAQTGAGLEELTRAIEDHAVWLRSDDRLARRRGAQAQAWLQLAAKERWGRDGARAHEAPPEAVSPFRRLALFGKQRTEGGRI